MTRNESRPRQPARSAAPTRKARVVRRAEPEQLSLALPKAEQRWGGRRVGAGRKPLPADRRKGLPHRSRPFHDHHHPTHVTIRIVRGLPSLRRFDLAKAIGETLRAGKERRGFRVVHFSIQPNHLHLIVEASGRGLLGRGMRGVGIRLARAVNRVLGRRGQVVGDRYHARDLTKPLEVRNAIVYVLANFRHHGDSGERFDPCSSARWFGGWTAPPPPQTTETPVAEPRTWLLHVGWRRHGRVRPTERPRT
jgi:hypothetical protein